MIKLFLADDELYIRQGIRHAIDWPSIGIELVGDADNGQSALNRILLTQPDIVLSDIRMPRMDGLELAGHIRNSLPQTRIVMLTGYSNTEYLVDAIRIGIRDYLFKPAGSEQICETICRIRDEIQSDRLEKIRLIHLENFYSEHLFEARSLLLQRFLLGQISSQIVLQQAGSHELKLSVSPYFLMLFEVNATDAWKAISQVQALGNDQNYLEVAYFAGCNQVLLLISQTPQAAPAAAAVVRDLAGQAVEQLKEKLPVHCVMICSDPVDELNQLPAVYQAMNRLLPRFWWFGQQQIIGLANLAELPEVNTEFELLAIDRLTADAHGNHGSENLKDKIAHYMQSLADKRPVFQQYQLLIRQLLIRLLSSQDGLHKLRPELIEQLQPDADIGQTMARLIELAGLNQNSSPRAEIIRLTLAYLEKHYRSSVTLDDVAQEVFISKSHLCRVLKEETGRGFNDLLNQIRIEKAKHLLGQKSIYFYEIAQMVGFSSYKQFAKHFMISTGISARKFQLWQKHGLELEKPAPEIAEAASPVNSD